jgi:hypothetical protein
MDHDPRDEAGHDRRNQSDEEDQQGQFLVFDSVSGTNEVIVGVPILREFALA